MFFQDSIFMALFPYSFDYNKILTIIGIEQLCFTEQYPQHFNIKKVRICKSKGTTESITFPKYLQSVRTRCEILVVCKKYTRNTN